MKKESLNTKAPLQKDNKLSNASLNTFDLPILIEKMKHQQSWAKGEPHSMILLKCPYKQIVLTAMHEGTEIEFFQANELITLQIIEGNLKFHSQNESIILQEGQLITFHKNTKYSLSTKEDTVVLLTIAPGTFHPVKN